MTYKIISLNVHSFMDAEYKNSFYEDAVKYINGHEPDVVFLCEDVDDKAMRKYIKTFQKIDEMDIGNSFLVKEFPKKDVSMSICKWPTEEMCLLIEQRKMLRLKMEHFDVLGVHLDHKSEKIRLDQIKFFLDTFENSKKPQILCGDFNSMDESEVSDSIKKTFEQNEYGKIFCYVHEEITNRGWTDAWKVTNREFSRTSKNTNARIDFIFVNSEFLEKFVINTCYVDTTFEKSDHYPVLMIFSEK